MIPLLVLLFVFSGMAGLIYESIWSRYLGLFVGHSAYAQIIVLVIFLGGMSWGAVVVGRRSEQIREPLLGYAAAEAIVGVLGLLFHPLFVATTDLAYDAWFPALAGSPWLTAVKWSLAGALILPQSVLLGMTFPLMSAGVLRRAPSQPGGGLALLYFANSFGAAVGVLLSGFFLVAAVGLPGTVATAGVINLAVAAAVLLAVRSEAPAARGPAAPKPPAGKARSRHESTPRETAPVPGLARLLLLVSFGTAVASFIYEIAWIRMLSLVLGSAAHSFEVMLSAFILGLALGALWVRTRADRFREPLQTLGILQWAMGSLALATLPLYLASFHWVSDVILGTAHTETGYQWFTLARYGICLAVMLPATLCAGTTLPLITRALMASGAGERAIGQVYGINTLGSILGASAAGLVLLPWLGPKGLLVAGALADVAIGVAILAFHGRGSIRSTRLSRIATAVTAVVVACVATFVRFDPLLLTSGVYRFGLLPDPDNTRILSYRHGRTASISIERYDATQNLTLSSNGKGDASLRLLWLQPEGQRPPTVFREDESTQILIGALTLAHAPRARSAAVIGHGSGMTSHVLLGSPHLESVTTVEIEPEVFRASRFFLPANRRVFEDPRSRLVVDDAKAYFAAAQRGFDLIVSEPSHPWVSGTSGLFSTEFYRRVQRHLTPDGVFGQWLHLYELNDDLVLGVLAAIHRNFRAYELFLVDDADMLIVAANRESGMNPDWSVFRYPGIAADLRNLPGFSPNLLEALRVGGRAALAPLVGTGIAPNSDFHPRLDLGAEKARYLGHAAEGFLRLHADRFSLTVMAGGHRVDPIPSWLAPIPEVARVGNLAMSAALRFPPQGVDAAQVDPRLPAAYQRKAWLQSALVSGTPPRDWRTWTLEAMNAENDWHLGTAGTADQGFFALLSSHLSHTHAPTEAFEAVDFVHDLAAWNLSEAARKADPLLVRAARGEDWLPLEVLLDGAVAAKLLTGDVAGARRALDALAARGPRNPGDLRTRLVAAWLHAAGPPP